jgi:hypothetical protein
MNVDAIEEEARDAGIVALHLLRRAQARALGIRLIVAGTPVQRVAQHYPSRSYWLHGGSVAKTES